MTAAECPVSVNFLSALAYRLRTSSGTTCMRANGERVVLVPDRAIAAAQQTLWDVLRIVTEPGGAAAFAALLSGQYRPSKGERVGVLLCGGNTTVVDFAGRTV